jgi:hypothetical protein
MERMDAIAQALADPSVRGWYLVFCLTLMYLPLVGLAIWFHRNIKKSAGGRALMARQRGSNVRARASLGDAALTAGEGVSMARDISAGRYGKQAKTMMTRVYWITGIWVALNAVTFGILIWADEINRAVE